MKALKIFGLSLAVVVVLVLAAIVVIPLVVDVDKYRPQVVEAVNDQIHGKLELGKLSLSLWGQIRIEVAGVKLLDTKGEPVISVNDAYFYLPFGSVLSGSPILDFKMIQPQILVVKHKDGKLNVMALMKEKPRAAAAAPGQPATSAPAAPSKPMDLPPMVTRARLGVEMQNALITYKDEGTGLDTKIKDFNVVLKDISLSRPTEIEVWADVDTTQGKVFSVSGPFRLTGQAQPTITNGQFDSPRKSTWTTSRSACRGSS
jgi:AsmA protein